MRAPRNPDGDRPLWNLVLAEAKWALKRRLAPRGTAVTLPAEPYLVLPVLGQSNAQGMGQGLDLGGADRPHPRVHQLAGCGPSSGTVVLAADPLLHDVPTRGVGFGVAFGKRLAEETGRAVLLVPASRGDTSFAPKNGYTWDPEDQCTRVNLYRNAVAAIDTALAVYPGSEVAAILWHQGETDVPLTVGPVYQQKLDAVIDDLRARYGADVPFLLGQMVPEEMTGSHHDYSVIDAIHADTPNRRARVAFVEGPRGATNKGDRKHYSAAGQRVLAASLWDAYRAVCTVQ